MKVWQSLRQDNDHYKNSAYNTHKPLQSPSLPKPHLLPHSSTPNPPHLPRDLSQTQQNGIIIGCIFAFLILIFAAFFYGNRRRIMTVCYGPSRESVELDDLSERSSGDGDGSGEGEIALTVEEPAPAIEEPIPEQALEEAAGPDPEPEAAPLKAKAAAPLNEREERIAEAAARAHARAAALEAQLAEGRESSNESGSEIESEQRIQRWRRARFADRVETIPQRGDDEDSEESDDDG
ncbi:hypothetical protein ACLMJK_006409 [Lecanora helva]